MRTTKERELKAITERINDMIEKDITWVWDLRSFNFRNGVEKPQVSFQSMYEYLTYDSGSQFKSYSAMSNKIIIGTTLYQF